MSLTESETTQLWHRRLAHINTRDLLKLHKYVPDVPRLKEMKHICRACRLCKAQRLLFPGYFEDAEKVGSIVHSDILGKLEPSFPDKFKYVSTFMDAKSRYTFVGMMCHRSEVHTVFDGVSGKFLEVGGAVIEKLHMDGDKEYISLQTSLGEGNEDRSFSPTYTTELNGIAERLNRKMVQGALSMLIQENWPSCLWPFAVNMPSLFAIASHIPQQVTRHTPYLLAKTDP